MSRLLGQFLPVLMQATPAQCCIVLAAVGVEEGFQRVAAVLRAKLQNADTDVATHVRAL